MVGGASLTNEVSLLGEGRGPGPSIHPVVGVLVLEMEFSEWRIYTLGEVGLSRLLCADWLSARLVALSVKKEAGGGCRTTFSTEVGLLSQIYWNNIGLWGLRFTPGIAQLIWVLDQKPLHLSWPSQDKRVMQLFMLSWLCQISTLPKLRSCSCQTPRYFLPTCGDCIRHQPAWCSTLSSFDFKCPWIYISLHTWNFIHERCTLKTKLPFFCCLYQ